MNLFQSLKFKVLVGTAFLFFCVFALYSYLVERVFTAQVMDRVTEDAARVSDVIRNSTRHSMLLNRRTDVYQIITTIGHEPDVEGIRIYNRRGMIMVSTNDSEEMTVVDMKAEACYACHDSGKPLQSLPTANRVRTYRAPRGGRVIGLINPIRNEPACSDADCHAHPAAYTVLGVLDVRLSLEKVDAEISRSRRRFIVYSLLMAAFVGGTSALFLLLTVHRPVRQLLEGTRQVAAGNLDYRIRVRSNDEMGELAGSFNEMTRFLQHAREQNQSWSRTLEQRIQEKTEELNRIHEQILQVEKMASLGRLSATVAHELNNPLEGILTYAKLTARRIQKVQDPAVPPIREDLELIVREVQRCGDIVKNLLLFSRKQVGEFGIASVAGIVEQAVRLVQHHFDISGVSFQQQVRAPDASILCDGNQIQQALLALFVNAVESMSGGGTIQLVVDRDQAGNTVVRVSDTGTGITPEELPHIFEPFYTTKKEGRGIGLGLSVVYGIVERHGGAVKVQSEPGKGSTFTLTFPPVAQGGPGGRAEPPGAD